MLDVEYGEQPRAFADAIKSLSQRHAAGWRTLKAADQTTAPESGVIADLGGGGVDEHVDGVLPEASRSAENAGGAADAFPRRLWQDLAEIGFFGLALDTSDAALEIAAVMEELGEQGCPGPLWETILAVRALSGDQGREGDAAQAIASGALIASVTGMSGVPKIWPWAQYSEVFVEIADDGLWECTRAGELDPVVMITGERWGRTATERRRRLYGGQAALALGEVAMAAYLVGAGTRLLRDASRYVATRVQFRRPIGDFQAVAFPLAEADASLAAARALVRRAACGLAEPGPGVKPSARVGEPSAAEAVPTTPRARGHGRPFFDATAAVLSAARAANRVTHASFQAYGAMAFTEECDAAYFGRRIAQLVTQALAPHRVSGFAGRVLEGIPPA